MLLNPSRVSASNPEPPDAMSTAGAQTDPFHFNTSPGEGGVLTVSTSLRSFIDVTFVVAVIVTLSLAALVVKEIPVPAVKVNVSV